MSKLRILVVDDHAILREGLKQILADNPKMVVTGEAHNGQEAVKKVIKCRYDVVLLDISMPDRNGLEVLREMKQRRPSLPVLILTMHTEEQYAQRALREGASGYITKESAPDELINAIFKVISGGRYITHSLAEKLPALSRFGTKDPPHLGLSLRELQMMSMMVSGKTVKEITISTGMAERTVRTYKHRIKSKLKVDSDLAIIRYATEHNLFT